jgi:hypothetical protein
MCAVTAVVIHIALCVNNKIIGRLITLKKSLLSKTKIGSLLRKI